MKLWIVTAAAVLAVSLNAAPENEQLKARQSQMLNRIQTELGLSDQQTKKWGEIQARYMQEHMKLRQAQNEEINVILSEAQQKKFEQMQQRFRQRLNQRMGEGQ